MEEETVGFWNNLQTIPNKGNNNHDVIISEDLNSIVGCMTIDDIVDTFREGTVNENGEKMFNF